jgi:hypothetical protein
MNTTEFHISTGKELLALKDRVRNLIYHWGEDGRYKEAVLKSVIQRFLPSRFIIGTGFVVRQTRIRGEHESSKQIDLLIYDTSFPILFKESDFVIVTPDSVRAIIEVKANLENQGLGDVTKKANEIGQFIFNGKTDKTIPFFNGIFSYEGFENLDKIDRLKNGINAASNDLQTDINFKKYRVNHISFNIDWFYKFWEQNTDDGPNVIYEIKDLSFSFLIGNLMDYLGGKSVIENSKLWFPVDKSFEVRERF